MRLDISHLAVCAALAAACGGDDEVAISVEMELDAESCGIGEPSALQLTCDATAGVWLRNANTRAVLERVCFDFEGDSHTLADLTPLLAGTDFATDAPNVIVEVAVYSPWQKAYGCPAPDELGVADPQVVITGTSAAGLSEDAGRVQVVLGCTALPGDEEPVDPPDDADEMAACLEECTADQTECANDDEIVACDNAFVTCDNACNPFDEDCFAACDKEYVACVGMSPLGDCVLDSETCFDGCDDGDKKCEMACDQTYQTCITQVCDGLLATCEQGCEVDTGEGGGGGEGPICASVTAP
ncbi:MAG TPA: hypothetical protein VNO33_24225 [Kofleriaceae bacterium]|nr:hypothetical protein [Kofleriaceae bacterium]